MQLKNHDRLVSLIPNFPPEYMERLEKFLASVKQPPRTTSMVHVARVERITKTGTFSISEFHIWGCHNVIKARFTEGKEGILSLFTQTEKKHSRVFLDYFINRSPYAPWILCTTPDTAISRGTFFNSNMPPNMFASACITSRMAYSEDFTNTFHLYTKMGLNEDLAFWLAHYLQTHDGKTLRYGSRGDHGTFSSAGAAPIETFQNYLQRNPAMLQPKTFRETTDNSTYGGVYALWGSRGTEAASAGVSSTDYMVDKFMAALIEYLENGVKFTAKSTYVNPFQKTVDFFAKEKVRTDTLSSKVIRLDKTIEERLRWFSDQMVDKAGQPNFKQSCQNLFTTTKVKAA
jgi:hypothetical protein